MYAPRELRRSLIALVAVVVLAVVAAACGAGRSPIQQARVDAVAYSRLVHDVINGEATVYASRPAGYGEPAHLRARQKLKALANAAIVYDDLAIGLHAGAPVTRAIADAQRGVADALTDLAAEFPSTAGWAKPIVDAIAAMRGVIPPAAFVAPQALQGQAVPPIFALLAMLFELIRQGRIAAADLVDLFKRKDVSDEEIAAGRAVLRDDIKAIDEEAKAAADKG